MQQGSGSPGTVITKCLFESWSPVADTNSDFSIERKNISGREQEKEVKEAERDNKIQK